MKRTLTIVVLLGLLSVLVGGFFSARKGSRNRQVSRMPEPTPAASIPGNEINGPYQSFTVRIPEGFRIEENGEDSRLITKVSDEPGAGPTNMIYVSVVPRGKEDAKGTIYNYDPEHFKKLTALEEGKSAVLGDGTVPELTQYFTYTRTEGRMVGGYGAKAYVNTKPWEFPGGTKEYRFIVETSRAQYIIGGYLGDDAADGYHISMVEFDAIIGSLKLTPDRVTSQNPPAQPTSWKTYSSQGSGLTFEYPSDWQVREGGQNFRDGDLFAVQIVGQSQRPQTEFHDGAAFTAMKPVTSDKEVSDWIRERYGSETSTDPDRPPQYSRETIGGTVYETVQVCGLGCFLYYHTKKNGNIYGFLPYAAGPDETSYQETLTRIMESVRFTP